MIAKAVKGKGFRGALEYDLTKEKGQLLDTNMAGKNPRQLAAEFGEIRKLKPNLGKAVLHVSLSAASGEKLTDAQWRDIGQHYLRGMGLDNNQYVMTRHMDTEHEHIHLVVNRIQFDGKVTSDSQDYKRQDALMRQIEKQFGLAEIAPAYGLDGKKMSGRKAPTKGEIEAGLRTDQPSIRLQLQRLCDTAAKDCDSVTQYRDRLAAVGVEILPAFQLAGAKLNGLTYRVDGVMMKGGDLGKAYSPVGLSKTGVTYDKNRDFESLSRGAERHQAEAAAGLAELGRAVNQTTTASIGRLGELKETNLRADREIGRAELRQAAQGLSAALQALAARRQAQELARRADALQALNTQLTLEKEIENDRIRREALSFLDSNIKATERTIRATGRALAFAQSDHAGIGKNLDAAGANLGRAVEVAGGRQHHRRAGAVAQALGRSLERLVPALAAIPRQVERHLVELATKARQKARADALATQEAAKLALSIQPTREAMLPAPAPSLADLVKASFAKFVEWISGNGGKCIEINTQRSDHYGPVVRRDDLHAVQRTSLGQFAIHQLDKLDQVPALEDPSMEIKYHNGTGQVVGKLGQVVER